MVHNNMTFRRYTAYIADKESCNKQRQKQERNIENMFHLSCVKSSSFRGD
jgi:hypothetical protein